MEQAVKKYQSIFPKKKDYSYLKQAILGLKLKSNILKIQPKNYFFAN